VNAIVASGDTADQALASRREFGFRYALRKPISFVELQQ
jgi:hypothetical protein